MISLQNVYGQPEETLLGQNELKLNEINEQLESSEPVILIRRKIQQKSLLEIRYARLKKALRSRSSSIL